jgi:hypothetical protein
VAPVAIPDRNRQKKYHSIEIGNAHANNDSVASTFMPRKVETLLHRRANQVDVTVAEVSNHLDSIKTGSSGV